MSFMRTLITVGAGFAAAKGIQKYQQMGGMAGVKSAMNKPGGMADQMGAMADKYGVPGGSQGMKDMMGKFGLGADNPANMAGMGGMMNAMGGAAVATGGSMADLFSSFTEGTAFGDAAEANAKLMIKAMIMAAKADGEIDAEEQAAIMAHLNENDPEEIEFVREQLAAPLDPTALAQEATEQTKAQVYSMSLMAITVDNMAEVQYLDALAAALGLTDETREQIHTQMGINQ
ncbi:MAG: DUF533 domain-containing protein [Pseudomonadota bacterium]